MKTMLIWHKNINDEHLAELWAIDDINGLPCYWIENAWGKNKFVALLRLVKRLHNFRHLSYIFKIRKIRNGELNDEEKSILKSLNYATGPLFE